MHCSGSPLLLCAAGGADAAADQASPAAGGAQQPAGTHGSSANGRWYGRAQRKGQLWVCVCACTCLFPSRAVKTHAVCICMYLQEDSLSGLDVVSARFGKISCFGLNHRLYVKDVTSIIWICVGSVLSCNHGYVDVCVAESDHILTKTIVLRLASCVDKLCWCCTWTQTSKKYWLSNNSKLLHEVPQTWSACSWTAVSRRYWLTSPTLTLFYLNTKKHCGVLLWH